MDLDLELISSGDKTALLALSTLEWLATTKSVLNEMGYKVHSAGNHEDFLLRFGRVQYQIVIIEELFAASTAEENLALKQLQHMPMVQQKCGDALKSMTIDQGISGGMSGKPAANVAVGTLTFDSLESFQSAMGPHMGEIMGDIPNYTDITPVLEISEIKL